MGRFAGSMNHHVEAPAVAHGHDRGFRSVLAGFVENRIEQRNQRGNAFEREALGAKIARLQNLFEKIGANQTLKDFVLINWAWRSFEPLNDPAAAFRPRQIHQIRANHAPADAGALLPVLYGVPSIELYAPSIVPQMPTGCLRLGRAQSAAAGALYKE